jgi:cell division protease FtsH
MTRWEDWLDMPDNRQRRGRWSSGDPNGGGTGMDRRVRTWLLWIGLALVAFWVLTAVQSAGQTTVDYSRFVSLVEEDKVGPLEISDTTISGTYVENGQHDFVTQRLPNQEDQALIDFLEQNDATYKFQPPNTLTQFLITALLPTLLLVGVLWFFLFRRMGGGPAGAALNLGRNKVRIYDRKEMKTTFADVAGLDEARDELREIVDFLSNPKKYQRLGGRIPKGVLLLGPPGCGKTLLARAVAGEANVPFFFMSGSEFVEMFVGLGAARVRELFQQAKDKAPALVFLDEIDTIGTGRGGGVSGGFGGHDEREQTPNQLLVEMDGFDASKGVIIMAATNRPDVLDPALVRPGRFDRQVVVDRPDLRGREEILSVHARGVALDPTVDLKMIASRTPGFTGADLANVVNEAALLAARREKNSVTAEELEEAIDRTTAGLERRSRVMSDRERVIVAKHEMGHALVALSVENADPVHRVSIIPRGAAALGMTMQRPLEDRYLLTEPELEDRLAILLGGRTAEEIAFDQISTGAQNDLEKATEIARAMVTEYGMSDKVGPLSFGHDGFRGGDGRPLFPGEGQSVSDATAQLVDEEVAGLLNDAHARAREIITRHRGFLDRMADLLMKVEVIDGDDLKDYFEGVRDIPSAEEVAADQAARAAERSKETGPDIITHPGPALPTPPTPGI